MVNIDFFYLVVFTWLKSSQTLFIENIGWGELFQKVRITNANIN